MNRSRAILAYLPVANSLFWKRLSSAHTQVNRFHSLHESLSRPGKFCFLSRFNPYQDRCFSTKPNSLVQLISANDWSDELEEELEKSSSLLNHETVVYILRKLDKDPQKSYCFFEWVRDENGFRPGSSVYSLMLRVLVQNRAMKQFWVTLRKMKEGGLYLDEETYVTILGILKKEKLSSDSVALNHFYERMLKENAMDSVAKRVVDVVLRSEWNDEIERELQDMKIVLSDNFVIRVLKELRNHPVKALEFFHWVDKFSSYKHNAVTYNAALRVLARQVSVEEFWGVVEEMKNAGHEMDLDSYIKISRQFQKFRMMFEAVKLYEFMMDGPFKPSIQDCNMLLRSLSAGPNPDLDLVYRVAKKYESTGHSLSKAVYDGIHRSLTSSGKFDEAEKIMNVMTNAGYKPDNITYSQLIFGLCRAKRSEQACKVLDDMEAQGCFPDIKTWTILIKGLCINNQVEEALMCFSKMVEKGLDADADLLDVLVDGFFRLNKIEGAYRLLTEMINQLNLKPWQATYKNLIEKLLSIMKFDEALDLLRLMKKQNYPPYPKPFDQFLAKFGTVDDVMEFFKVLSIKDYPSFSSYLNVFESFLEEGRHAEAKDLLFKCPHHVRAHPKMSELFGSANTVSCSA